MSQGEPRLLLVDDNPDDRLLAIRDLRQELPNLVAVEVTDPTDFERALAEEEFDAVITDYHLHWATGIEVFVALRERWPETPVIMYTGSGTEEIAVAATRAGLFDYVVKTQRHRVRLAAAVRAALEASSRRRELRATEDLFRIMFEQCLAGMYLGAPDGRLLDCNMAFAHMFGYEHPRELQGRVATELVADPEMVDIDRRMMFEAGGTLSNRDALGRRKDGSVFHAMYSARFHDATPPGLVIATIVDVTESHQAKELLRNAAMEWRATFDAISSPIALVRPDGFIIRVNAAGRWLAGLEFPSVVGQHLATLGPGEPWRTAAELVTSVVDGRRQLTATVRDPVTERTWEVTASPAASGPEQVVALVMRDISEVVALQESVVRNQTMSALGQLIAGVAHEVRSPLFGISATLDAFDARYGQEPNFRTYLHNLRREIARLNDLMRDLLELGKPATTPRKPERFGSLIEESLEACRALGAQQQVSLVLEISDRTNAARVLVDRRRCLQVFENLFKNAIQYSPSGARVTIRDDPTRLSEHEVTVSILDNGSGFRPEDLPRLFEPFFTRRAGGTGLGLAIVLRILEDHGGSAVAENRPDGGAVVHVTLPLHSDYGERPA